MNVCKERGIECDFATGLGFCSVTGCRKQIQISNISIIPTVTVTDTPMVEYAPVVRCKDCKHLGENDGYYFCNAIGIAFGDKPNWFCADGERRSE